MRRVPHAAERPRRASILRAGWRARRTRRARARSPVSRPRKLDWAAGDIAYYLETGFTPDFDSAGGEMVEVIKNMAKLSPEDRAAIAAYVKALPAVE